MDCVVTVPKALWASWIGEGDLPGERWSGYLSHFMISPRALPNTQPGERVYVVAHGRLRGYAPLWDKEAQCSIDPERACLLRVDGAVAVTIPAPIPGFRGIRYRWWDIVEEVPFPSWREP